MSKLFQIPILLLAMHALAQAPQMPLARPFPQDVKSIAVDPLENIYAITLNGQVKKWNSNGDSVAVYNQIKRYGNLHSMDVSNALKLLLFYKDFSTVVVLDRLLTQRAAINLRLLNIVQASAIGLSYDGNIWLFDAYEAKLKKIDESGVLLLQTPDFRTIFPQSVVPQQIWDNSGTVYLYDSTSGLYLFDYYGSFKKLAPITGWQHVANKGNVITGIKNGQLQWYNTATLMPGSRPLPFAPAAQQSLYIANQKIFAAGNDSLRIYNYPF